MIALLFSTFVSSCDERSINPVLKENIQFQPKTKRDHLSQQFAVHLSSSLKDEAIREFIKKEVSKKFDGDYNILFQQAKNKEISTDSEARGSVTFAEASFGNNRNGRSNSNDSLLTQLEEEYPTMQIAIPNLENKSVENWKTGSHQPLVAILPSDYDESTHKTIIAYSSDGTSKEISTENEPDELVVVISPSERVMAFPRQETTRNHVSECFLSEPILTTASFDYYLDQRVLVDCGGSATPVDDGGGGNTGGDTSGSDCDVQNIHTLELHDEALKHIESWASGAPEIKLLVYTNENGYNTKPKHFGVYEPTKRKYIRDPWPVNGAKGNNLFNWNDGSEFLLWFYEKDEPFGSIYNGTSCDELCVSGCGDYPTPYSSWNCVKRRHDQMGSFIMKKGIHDGLNCNEELNSYIKIKNPDFYQGTTKGYGLNFISRRK